jgi:hypothetical protein
MKRPQLERIRRAAAGITGADRFVVIGSQTIPGQFPEPCAKLLVSMEGPIAADSRGDDRIVLGRGEPAQVGEKNTRLVKECQQFFTVVERIQGSGFVFHVLCTPLRLCGLAGRAAAAYIGIASP